MIIKLKKDDVAAAVGGIKQWLKDFGGISPGAVLPTGEDPGWKAAYKLLADHGEGDYEVAEDGKLKKDGEVIIHNDDVNAFGMGIELKVKIEKKKEEVKEAKVEVKVDKKKK